MMHIKVFDLVSLKVVVKTSKIPIISEIIMHKHYYVER
jgi:hypothetical protein